MRGHWRRVFTDRKYRRRWGHFVGASTSSWWFVLLYGGHYGGTLSAEVERRRIHARPLGLFLTTIRFFGNLVLGREHWALAYRNEQFWVWKTSADPGTDRSRAQDDQKSL